MNLINEIEVDEQVEKQAMYTSCIILTHDEKILLQFRPPNWRTFPGYICCFGGKIDADESPQEAIIREINEEVGGQVMSNRLRCLGAYTEQITEHKEIIFGYFWHDKNNTITGCYEAEAKLFNSLSEVELQPKVMDDTMWLLRICANKNLI